MFGGKIGTLFGRKAEVPQKLPAPQKTLSIPQNASYGDFFRTRAFVHPETGTDFVMWYQATREPFGNKWLVQEIWQHPNTVSGAASLLEESKTLNGGQAVSFEEALRALGRYEHAQPKMEYIPYGPSAEELGDEHVNAFALHNGIAFDEHGVPHMSHRGRILDDGCFLPETKKAVLDLYRQGVTVKLPWDRASLIRTLGCQTILVGDPSALITLKEEFSHWQKFMGSLQSLVEDMISAQHYDHDYTKSTEGVRKHLAVLSCVSAADKAEVYEPFLAYLTLVQSVAVAKVLYGKMSSSEGDIDRISQKFAEFKSRVVSLCLEQGVSAQDVACLQAEIMNKEKFKVDSKKSMSPLLRLYRIAGYHTVYYLPDAVPEFIAALPAVTAEFERRIVAEEARIVKPLSQLPAPTPEGGPR